jgi:ABC-type transporter Mla subunit MlaD
VEPVRLDQVAARMGALLDSVARVLEENPGAVASLLRGVGGFSETAGGVLKENRDQLRALLESLTGAARQMDSLARAARSQLPPGEKTARIVDDTQQTMAGLAAATRGLTDDDGKRVRQALASYAAAGEKLDRIAARANGCWPAWRRRGLLARPEGRPALTGTWTSWRTSVHPGRFSEAVIRGPARRARSDRWPC